MGTVLVKLGRPREAAEAAAELREAVRLDPEDRESRANLDAVLGVLDR
jgi:hypothetical protein